jgi:hypothetical protein
VAFVQIGCLPGRGCLTALLLQTFKAMIGVTMPPKTDNPRLDPNFAGYRPSDLISTKDLREQIGEDEFGNGEDFNAHFKQIEVCEGPWHREAIDWRF